MNDKINDGGPAFPIVTDTHIDGGHGSKLRAPNQPQIIHGGMSLRDWFAGQALAGMLANPDWIHNNIIKPDNGTSIPELAYEVADAMLAARAKGGAQ